MKKKIRISFLQERIIIIKMYDDGSEVPNVKDHLSHLTYMNDYLQNFCTLHSILLCLMIKYLFIYHTLDLFLFICLFLYKNLSYFFPLRFYISFIFIFCWVFIFAVQHKTFDDQRNDFFFVVLCCKCFQSDSLSQLNQCIYCLYSDY